MRRRLLIIPLLAFAAVAACASARGSALYRRDIGTASGPDALTLAHRLVQKHHYEVFSIDSIPELLITTHWRPRPPFADEQALGINAAESRMLISARQRGQTDMGAVYTIDLTLENRVRALGTVDWTESINTDMFVAYADEIVNEYRQWVTQIGVRRF